MKPAHRNRPHKLPDRSEPGDVYAEAFVEMRIGDLSREIDLSIQTIRFYEKEGLIGLPERTEGRFRVFSSHQRVRLVFIKTLRELGFPLEEVRSIVKALDSGAGEDSEVATKLKASVLKRQQLLSKLADVLKDNADGKALKKAESVFAA